MNSAEQFWAELDSICDLFEAAWARNEPQTIESFRQHVDEAIWPNLLHELIRIEIWWRRERGSQPTVVEYQQRFGCMFMDWTQIAHEISEEAHSDAVKRHRFQQMKEESAGRFAAAFSESSVGSTRIASQSGVSTRNPADGHTQDLDSKAPERFGRYECVRLLGEGAFGRVWLSYDSELHRQVAIKVPKLRQTFSANQTQQFLDEARRVATLNHPNIVPVLDVGRTSDDLPFFVSHYVDGVSLKTLLESGAIEVTDAARIIHRLADALHHAHLKGVIHRDVKPANILIDKDSVPFLTDFGLALVISEQYMSKGEVSGSPAYMSPEQVRGLSHQLDGRTDIWSLGVILYEMLTGKRPFAGHDLESLFDDIGTRSPRPLRQISDLIPEQIETACLQALAKDMEHRYSTALDFGNAVKLAVEWKAKPLQTNHDNQQTRSENTPVVFNVPPLPPCYIERKEHLEQLRQLLFSSESSTIGLTGTATIGIHGRGGLGKSVVAAALLRDEAVRQKYRDGVVWLTFGQTPNLATLQTQLAKVFGSEQLSFETSEDFTDHLASLWRDRHLLIVLDDVWDTNHVKRFLVTAPSVRFLVTTRDGRILTRLNAEEYGLDVLDEAVSLKLLSDWTGESVQHLESSVHVHSVMRQSGRLPLAIAVCGAMRRDGLTWADIAEALAENALDFLEEDVHYNYRSVLKCLAVGVDFLAKETPADAQRYQELAVFPKDTSIPEEAIQRLWSFSAGLSRLHARKLLTTLNRKNLLTIHEREMGLVIEFHDLQHDYLRFLADQNDSTVQYESLLVDSYLSPQTGHALEDDGYYYQFILNHLRKLDRIETCHEMLLSTDWLSAKLKACGLQNLLEELISFQDDVNFRMLARCLRLSAHVISEDPSQLYGQLIGRLSPRMGKLIAPPTGADETSNICVPITHALTTPGNLLQTLRGADVPVTAVVAIPQSNYIVSGHYDGAVILWDIQSGSQVRTFKQTRRPIRKLRYSMETRLLVIAAEDDVLQAVDIENDQRGWSARPHSLSVLDFELASEEKIGISCSRDGTIACWDVGTGEILDIHAATGTLTREIATGKSDSEVKWSGATGGRDLSHIRRIRIVPGTESSPELIAGLRIGSYLLLWSIEPFVLRNEVSMEQSLRCNALAVDQLRRRIVTGGSSGEVRVWDADFLGHVNTLGKHHSSVQVAEVSPDGRYAVTGASDCKIMLWDLEKLTFVAEYQGHGSTIRDLALLSDGRRVASASDDGTVKIWDMTIAPGVTVRSASHNGPVSTVLISADNRACLSAGRDGAILEYDLASGTSLRTVLKGDAPIVDMALDSDEATLFLIREDRRFEAWTIGNKENELLFEVRLSSPLHSLSLSPDGTTIVVLDLSANLYVFDTTTGQQVGLYFSPTRIRPKFTPDGKHLVTVDQHGSVGILDLSDNREHLVGGHADTIQDFEISTDGSLLISVGADTLLKAWDLTTCSQRGNSMRGHDRIVNCCVLSQDSSFAVTGGNDGVLVKWNLASERETGRMSNGPSRVTQMKLIDDDHRLVSVSENGSICLWDVQNFSRLGAYTCDARVESLAASSIRIVAGDVLGNIHILSIK